MDEEEANAEEILALMGTCTYFGCLRRAVWTRKEGWGVAPGSPPGDVCEVHHCWKRIEE